MDRTTLTEAIKRGPVKVHMNDGASFEMPAVEIASVSDISAHILYRDEDGKYLAHILALVCMVRIEGLERVSG